MDPGKIGLCRRQTWQGLADTMQQWAGEISGTDGTLLLSFLEYMNTEQIAFDWSPKNLDEFHAGMKAYRAIKSIFEAIVAHPNLAKFETRVHFSRNWDEWPKLEIGKPEWTSWYEGDYCRFVWLFLTVPGVWEAESYAIYPELNLWVGGDWMKMKPKLATVAPELRKEGFSGAIHGAGWPGKFDPSFSASSKPPRRVLFWKEGSSLSGEQLLHSAPHELIETLVKIVDGEVKRVDSILRM